MTALATDLVDLRRWLVCGAIVVLAHGGFAAAMIVWHDPVEAAAPAGAIVIELAPVAVAPASEPSEIAPGPEQLASDASPDRPTETVEERLEERPKVVVRTEAEETHEPTAVEEAPAVVPPAPDADVAIQLAARPQPEQPSPQRAEPRPPAPTTSAPQQVPVETAALPAAPTPAPPRQTNSKAVPSWTVQIVGMLERNKRYPAEARSRREQGVAQVAFSLDRKGRVIESRIVRSSGAAALDQEALALLRRAQPFPAPPAELPGERIDLSVPIRFKLR